ncbi:hypothetical protein PV08_11612 [Exophiala spinifera]|uniref:Uncharacterized protein n=1 Tax=Exophiala spinifera TaxID=91928 RepID=A0A0D2AV99_9EURO|nr:uncharacterized protein PV08_11612 [Exophiala spinifera]KIW10648.1 hypothetical protein PV08_11612 [Exophiala spinifera]
MNPQPCLLDDGLCKLPKAQSVGQVDELSLLAPSEDGCHVAMLGRAGVVEVVEQRLLNGSEDVYPSPASRPVQKSPVYGSWRRLNPSRRRRSSLDSAEEMVQKNDVLRLNLRLPHSPRKNLIANMHRNRVESSTNDAPARRRSTTATVPSSVDFNLSRSNSLPVQPLSGTQSWPQHDHSVFTSSLIHPCGIVPLLTPPEDLDAFKWDSPVQAPASEGIRAVSDYDPDRSHRPGPNETSEPRPRSTSRPSGIQMPERTDLSQDDSSRSDWLGRVCQQLVSSLGDSANQHQIQMVVQALPSQPKSKEIMSVFEQVVQAIQTRFSIAPYITITHAVSQVISMDEVPASPPATPNTNYAGDDYFQDQTIFTHAAMVPAYHSHPGPSTNVGSRPSNIIAAPSSIQVSILERYIPPTTPQEIKDFFTLSRRSYLADRLLELSAVNGTLLLIYPTRQGALTFANKYVNPIIEPFLRHFVLLNGLFMHVANTLGSLPAVEAMKTYEELREALSALCGTLSQRSLSRGVASRYEIVHSETADVVLDRSVWVNWFVDQEHHRLRENLVDYHKSGGRMPSPRGQIDVTPAMLAREVVDGVRQSREQAGNVALEVGVFVIRRSSAAPTG